MQFPFRRPPASPTSFLLVPGKTPQGFAEDTSAAEEDSDLRNLMRCLSHLVQTYSDKKGDAAARGNLLRELVVVAPRFAEAAGRHRLCFAWRDARMPSALLRVEDTRGADGIRRACAALCNATGLLRAASEGEGEGDGAVGCQLRHMSDACMAAFEALMLAQALEFYFELAVAPRTFSHEATVTEDFHLRFLPSVHGSELHL
ncbi:hypothetical protein D1007_44454 [Hordeum vulgare]|nr:hypothetical protein D1007_44454 [Hordeum vulgare]